MALTDHLPSTIKPIRVDEQDTVDVYWRLQDGTIWKQRVTCPPKSTRDASPADRQP